MALRLISDGTRCHPLAKILDLRQSEGQSYLIQAKIIKLDKKI
jgi:hypothetical protein